MKKFDIFRSEGGYRVCGGVWMDGPVMDASPWFSTHEEAERIAACMKEEDFEQDAFRCAFDGLPECLFSPEVRRRAAEIEREMADEANRFLFRCG